MFAKGKPVPGPAHGENDRVVTGVGSGCLASPEMNCEIWDPRSAVVQARRSTRVSRGRCGRSCYVLFFVATLGILDRWRGKELPEPKAVRQHARSGEDVACDGNEASIKAAATTTSGVSGMPIVTM